MDQHRNPLTIIAIAVLLATTVPAPEAEARVARTLDNARNCDASDYSGGAGGQDVSCPLTCIPGDTVSISVHAQDPDAEVWGEVECGDADVDCPRARQTCTGSATTAEAGNGTCEGHSEEIWDSGLTVECNAAGGTAGGPGDTPNEVCVDPGVSAEVCIRTNQTERIATLLSLWLPGCATDRYADLCTLPASAGRATKVFWIEGHVLVLDCVDGRCVRGAAMQPS